MHFLRKTGLMILLIFTLSPLSWAASPPYLLAKQDYLYDAFFKLEAVDMMGRGTDQLVVLGRDYTGHRISVQLLCWTEGELVSEWESPNLIEERPVALATGAPLPTGERFILVLTQKHLYLYTYQNERMILFDQIYHSLSPFDLSVADLDGDGIDELLIVNLGQRMANYDEKVVEVYRLDGGELQKIGASPHLGNIRCLAGGDLDGDGRAEVVTESGLSYRAGTFTLLRWDPVEARLVPEIQGQKLLSSLALAMQVVSEGKGRFLLHTADGWGRLNFFLLEQGKFLSRRPEYSFPNGLVGVAAGDLDGDGSIEGIVAGHPNNLMVFTLVGVDETEPAEETAVESNEQQEAGAEAEARTENQAREEAGSGVETEGKDGRETESQEAEETVVQTAAEKKNPPEAATEANLEAVIEKESEAEDTETEKEENPVEAGVETKTEVETEVESGIKIEVEVEITIEDKL